MATALAQASRGIGWNQLLARAEEDLVEDDAPPGVEKAAITPMAAAALWEESCMDLAPTLTPHGTRAAKEETTAALCAEQVFSVALANAAAHRGRCILEPARSLPTPQQKPRRSCNKQRKQQIFETFEFPEEAVPPAHPMSAMSTMAAMAKDSKDSKDGGESRDRRDKAATSRGAADRSESPSPWRCRPPGYSLKRRAVASAVATALDAVDMAERTRAKRITLVA